LASSTLAAYHNCKQKVRYRFVSISDKFKLYICSVLNCARNEMKPKQNSENSFETVLKLFCFSFISSCLQSPTSVTFVSDPFSRRLRFCLVVFDSHAEACVENVNRKTNEKDCLNRQLTEVHSVAAADFPPQQKSNKSCGLYCSACQGRPKVPRRRKMCHGNPRVVTGTKIKKLVLFKGK